MTGKSLLLVDDETSLVELLKKYLERGGYQVRACTDPRAALDLIRANPTEFSLVITDLSFQEMSGEELIEHIRATNQDIPVIIASGYPYQPRAMGVEFLQKPFLPKMLLEVIHRILGDSEDAGSARA